MTRVQARNTVQRPAAEAYSHQSVVSAGGLTQP